MATSILKKPWIWTVPIVVSFFDSMFSISGVYGRSMQPTFNPNTSLKRDFVLINKLSFINHAKVDRGDIVAFWSPSEEKHLIVKRIIGLPGDQVTPRGSNEPILIPAGRIWVEGDEPFHSRDSNYYGPIPLGLIHGRVAHIIWPLSRWGTVNKSKDNKI